MSIKNTALFIFAGAVLVGSAVYLLYQKNVELSKATSFRADPRPVTVARSRLADFVETHAVLAEVEASQTTRITSRVRAAINAIPVDEGDRVQQGDVLVELDDREVQERISALQQTIKQVRAEKRAREAERDALEQRVAYWEQEVDRYEGLVVNNSVKESELVQYRDTLANVRGNLEATRETISSLDHRINSLRDERSEARTRRGYYRLKSPYDARVAERHVDHGDMASPGGTLLTLEDISGARLAFDLPQTDHLECEVGDVVRFGADGTFTAELSLLHPSFQQNRLLRAEVRLSDEQANRFRSGEFVSAEVVVHRYPNTVHVPRTAVIESPDGSPYVFVVDDNTLEARSVEVLAHRRDRAAVNGLNEGETVVKHTYLGWTLLNSDQPVEPIRSP